MATNDVPGANPANKDKLARGAWAEHEDGSMIYVVDIDENGRVIFNIYDMSKEDGPVFYPNALSTKDFEETFSFNPKKKKDKKVADIKWTWHDKTPMDWNRVMKVFDNPTPQHTTVAATLSAAARIAQSLQSKVIQHLSKDDVISHSGKEARPAGNTGKKIRDRLRNAMKALVD